MNKQIGTEYNVDWSSQAAEKTPREWAREYSRVFKADMKRHSWKALKPQQPAPLTKIQEVAIQQVQAAESLLDVGCGPGYFVCACLGQGISAFGIDVAEDAVFFCKDHYDKQVASHFFIGDINDLPDTRQYEVVTCLETLEHLLDPETAFIHLWKKVEEDGLLVISVPKGQAVPSPYHLEEFTETRLEKMARSIGVESSGDCTYRLGEHDYRYLLVVQKHKVEVRYALILPLLQEAQMANDLATHDEIKTSLWNWVRHMQGKALGPFELEKAPDYDVVHVQLAGPNLETPGRIRKILGDSDTQLIVTCDYALEFWGAYTRQPEFFLDALRCADYITSVEPLQARLLADVLGQEVHILNHPIDVELMQKKWTQPPEKRSNIVVCAHRDFVEVGHLAYWTARDMGEKTVLFGFGDAKIEKGIVPLPYIMFDKVCKTLSGEEAIELISQAKVMIDYYSHSVFGRSAVEAACLGIPCIGYVQGVAQEECFPQLTIMPGDIAHARELLRRLLDDQPWYYENASYAQQQVWQYDAPETVRKFKAILKGESECSIPPTGSSPKNLESLTLLSE